MGHPVGPNDPAERPLCLRNLRDFPLRSGKGYSFGGMSNAPAFQSVVAAAVLFA
jgi:hypothetical protein